MRRAAIGFFFFVTAFLSGCVTNNEITDFTNLSVVYGWVDLENAKGNEVVGGSIKGFNLPPDQNRYPIGYSKLGTGYVIFHVGVQNGPMKVNTIETMNCIGLCGNVINVFDFGAQGGDILAANIKSQGVYFLGNFALVSPKGLFAPREFDVVPTKGPSKRQMLELILEVAAEQQKPLIRAELARLQ